MPDHSPHYRTIFEDLAALPANGDRGAKQRRGKAFEQVLHSMLRAEQMDPRTSYRPDGEEIDGSFVFQNRVYLLEAKWQAAPLPASSLYAFKGKVDGKLVGTVGIFISMSGYSEDAEDALRFGKTVNLLLFDGDEIGACIRGEESFGAALASKLRAAAEEGLAYSPRRVRSIVRRSSGDITTRTESPEESSSSRPQRSLVIVCEGPRDAVLLGGLAKRLMRDFALAGEVSVFPAMGKAPLGGLVNIARRMSPDAAVIVVADGDGNIADTIRMVAARTTEPVTTIAVDPTIERAWLDLGQSEFNRLNSATAEKMVESMSIDTLMRTSESFRAFVDALRKELGK